MSIYKEIKSSDISVTPIRTNKLFKLSSSLDTIQSIQFRSGSSNLSGSYWSSLRVNFYLSVPCKLLSNMISILEKDKEIYYSSVPREEEGMGICAGAYLGNKIPCLLWWRYFRTTNKNWFISTIDNKLDDVDGSLLPIANNYVYFGSYKGC